MKCLDHQVMYHLYFNYVVLLLFCSIIGEKFTLIKFVLSEMWCLNALLLCTPFCAPPAKCGSIRNQTACAIS